MAGNGGGGIAVENVNSPGGTSVLTDSVVSANSAANGGSGVLAADGSSVSLVRTTVTCNVAGGVDGGGVRVTESSNVTLDGGSIVAHNYWLDGGELPTPPQSFVTDTFVSPGSRLVGHVLALAADLSDECPGLPACNASGCNGAPCSVLYTPAAAYECNCTGHVYPIGASCNTSLVS